MPSAVSGHFLEFAGCPISLSFLACCIGLELRPLPSIGVTRLQWYYEPLRHPIAPGLSLAGLRLVVRPTARWGFPCCACFPLSYMPSSLSRRNGSVLFSLASLAVAAFPDFLAGRLPHLRISRPAQRSLTLRPACSPSPLQNPLHQRLQPFRYLRDRSGCYRQERKLPGGIRTRWKTAPLHGAQEKTRYEGLITNNQ